MKNLVSTPMYACGSTLLGILLWGMMGWLPVQLVAETHPDDPPPNTQGRSAGSRGCNLGGADDAPLAEIPALVLLSSGDIAATVSPRPTFAWFSRDNHMDVPHAFRLYEVDNDSQTYRLLTEIEGELMPAGILVLPFPSGLDDLSVGRRYLWQVELTCDPDRPSGNLFAEAEFDVVSASANLSDELLAATTNVDKADIYMANNLWYDALALALANTPMSSLRQRLFNQVALNETEKSRFENSTIHVIEHAIDYEN